MNQRRPPLPPLNEVFAGKHLIVTGITGFLGKVWLTHLLHHLPEIGKLTLLVRPPRGGTALERFARIADTSPAFRPLKQAHGDDFASYLRDRVEVLASDIAEPMCGLSNQEVDRLAATADAVVHIAGLTDFQPDPRKGLPANVEGSLHVADLAARLRRPRMIQVSTCYVTGTATGHVPERVEKGIAPCGDRFDPKAELEELRGLVATHPRAPARIEHAAARAVALGWPNLYTYTKGLSEHLLLSRDDIEVVFVRPSVVECARSWPFSGWNEGLNTSAPIMWYCGTLFRRLPSRGHHRFDIIPVDAVARWLTVATARHLRGEAHRVYQLATSDANPTTFERIVELTALGHRRHAFRPSATLWDRMAAALDIRPADRIDDPGWVHPARLETLGNDLASWLGELDPDTQIPRPLRGLLAGVVKDAVRKGRRRALKSKRDMGRLRRMLEIYQPFIHDHDWEFSSAHIRAEQASLHPSDRAAFADDCHEMCWREYWLSVQYPGVQRWSFPLMAGETVADDAPSLIPLRLDEQADEADAEAQTEEASVAWGAA